MNAMCTAMIGLGKVGGNMAARLYCGGIGVVGYDRSIAVLDQLALEAVFSFN